MQEKALAGIKVLDLSRVLAGPYCSMLLGDYGADIVKVEAPQRGDDTRHWGPPWAGGESAYFLSVNRNKRSLTLDLKNPKGQALLHSLAMEADILLENFRVGTTQKWGIDYTSLQTKHPGIIYCSVSGYGQNGPNAKKAGYDFAIQAQGGIMSISGPPEQQEGSKVGVAIVDITAGLFASNAILAALQHRNRTGEGQYIDVALFDAQLAWLANVAQNHLVSGDIPGRYGNAHPNIVPYQTFMAKDRAFALAVGNDRQYQNLCQVADCMELWDEPKYQTNAGRVEHRAELVALLGEIFAKKTVVEWLELLESVGIPCAPINNVAQAFEEPQVEARDMLQEISHPTAGMVRLVGPVAKLSKTPAEISAPPPLLGQHNAAILSDWLGLSEEDLQKLQDEGAFGEVESS